MECLLAGKERECRCVRVVGAGVPQSMITVFIIKQGFMEEEDQVLNHNRKHSV